jgi:hypothetical protein
VRFANTGEPYNIELRRRARFKTLTINDRKIHDIKGQISRNASIQAGMARIADIEERYLRFILNATTKNIDMEIIDPEGKALTEKSGDVTIAKDEIPVQVFLERPKRGEYTIKLNGQRLQTQAEPFWVLVTATDDNPLDKTAGCGGIQTESDDVPAEAIYGLLILSMVVSILAIMVVAKKRAATRKRARHRL